MQYTKDDYRKDLEIVALGANGVEATEAQLRIRLYEAGRYEQLNAFVNQKSEPERAHERMMEEWRRIDNQVFQWQQIWLNTPISDHKLFQERKEVYEQMRKKAEEQKAQLKEEYERKYYSQKTGGSAKAKAIGILMVIGGLVLPLGSCACYGWDAPAGTLWGFVIAAVGAFVYLMACA